MYIYIYIIVSNGLFYNLCLIESESKIRYILFSMSQAAETNIIYVMAMVYLTALKSAFFKHIIIIQVSNILFKISLLAAILSCLPTTV